MAMPSPSSAPTELLAPAGSVEAFFAAMEAGADAVYCGLTEFSARARARNFSLEDMEGLTAYAHQQGRRLYVAANTLIKEQELPRLLEVLAALAACRVDALIIQDLGLWRLARRHFPDLALHASTQMAIHNAAGVRMLEEMGFSRAVLARELSLAEIADIRQHTSLELEHFIHGALCYSISGHCLFSSFLSGQSGNRGRCAQPCRRRYRLRGKPGFYFSTSDLGAIALVPQLIEAGVMSLKIEGRMKNAEYVSTVVQAYRQVLDAPLALRRQAIRAAEGRLTEAYGRSTTCGLLRGVVPVALAQPTAIGGIGRALGTVERAQGGDVWLTLAETLHVGDRLRIQPQTDQAGSSFTVQGMSVNGKTVKRAAAASRVRIATPFRGQFQARDQVYKVGAGKTFTMSEEACRRRLANTLPPPQPLRLVIDCRHEEEEERGSLALTAEVAGCILHREFAVEMLPAANSPLSRETLESIFAKTGQPGLRLDSLAVGALPPVAIKPSRLKALRREFYAALHQVLVESLARRQAERLAAARASLLPARAPQAVDRGRLAVLISDPRDLVAAGRDLGAQARLILALSPEMVAEAVRLGPRLGADWSEGVAWELPAIIYGADWSAFQMAVDQLVRRGFRAFRLNNLGHLALFTKREALTLLAGPWLYAVNSQAALALAELGAAAFCLSIEDDSRNMAEVLSREVGIPAMAIVYGPIPLVTSRIPMRGVRAGALLESEAGGAFRIETAGGLTTAYSGQEFSLLGEMARLRAMGCGEVLIDLSAVGLASRRGREVLAAAGAGQGIIGTTSLNFERGLA